MNRRVVRVVSEEIKVGRVVGRGLESKRCRLCRVSLGDSFGAWLSRF